MFRDRLIVLKDSGTHSREKKRETRIICRSRNSYTFLPFLSFSFFPEKPVPFRPCPGGENFTFEPCAQASVNRISIGYSLVIPRYLVADTQEKMPDPESPRRTLEFPFLGTQGETAQTQPAKTKGI